MDNTENGSTFIEEDDSYFEKIVLTTTPYDHRFPNTNQTKNCYQNFIDWKICERRSTPSNDTKSPLKDPCLVFKKAAKELCPSSWINRWEDQIEEGIFPHPLDNNK